nr:unnamed protein product [Digitaria exilis]
MVVGGPALVDPSSTTTVMVRIYADASPFVVRCGGRPLLEVCGLTVSVKETGQQILTGVALTIREGEICAIMGKNGSGKSTLTKVLVVHPYYEFI